MDEIFRDQSVWIKFCAVNLGTPLGTTKSFFRNEIGKHMYLANVVIFIGLVKKVYESTTRNTAVSKCYESFTTTERSVYCLRGGSNLVVLFWFNNTRLL